MLKKLLVLGMVSVAVATSAMAGNITKNLSIQAKHVDIKDAGVKAGTVLGLKYMFNNDIGQSGAWGFRAGIEFDYGKLNNTDKGDSNYYDFLFTVAPSYTFDCNLKVYAGAKAGYVDIVDNSDDSSSDDSKTSGSMILGVVGAEYPITENIVIGAEGTSGNSYFNGIKYKTTTYSANLGWRF